MVTLSDEPADAARGTAADKIRVLRAALGAGVTQERLAELCGLTRVEVVQLETGKNKASSYATRLALARGVDVPVDGSCTADNAIGQGQMCGALACAKSLTAGPLTVTGEACGVVLGEPATPTPPATWQTAALACKRGSSAPCDDPTQVCAPVAVAPPGFALCVFQAGDVDCPSTFPDKHGVATGADDKRGCAPCACGAPMDGLCVATLNVFTDDVCAAPLLSVQVGSTGPGCFDLVPPGPALGSKSLDKLKYVPGTCAPSGGEAAGQVMPTGPATFCCRP